jgi:hypothetical protein
VQPAFAHDLANEALLDREASPPELGVEAGE